MRQPEFDVHSLFGLDPELVDPAGGDYRLTADSPAVDGGVTLAEFNYDFDMLRRPQGDAWDRGPLELSDDGSDSMALQVIGALNGRAAIAECRGDADTAAEWYGRAAERAGTRFPGLAAQANARAESAAANVTAVTFPPKDPNRGRVQPVKGGGGTIEPGLATLINPDGPPEANQ